MPPSIAPQILVTNTNTKAKTKTKTKAKTKAKTSCEQNLTMITALLLTKMFRTTREMMGRTMFRIVFIQST